MLVTSSDAVFVLTSAAGVMTAVLSPFAVIGVVATAIWGRTDLTVPVTVLWVISALASLTFTFHGYWAITVSVVALVPIIATLAIGIRAARSTVVPA